MKNRLKAILNNPEATGFSFNCVAKPTEIDVWDASCTALVVEYLKNNAAKPTSYDPKGRPNQDKCQSICLENAPITDAEAKTIAGVLATHPQIQDFRLTTRGQSTHATIGATGKAALEAASKSHPTLKNCFLGNANLYKK